MEANQASKIEELGTEAFVVTEFERCGVPGCGSSSTLEGELISALAKMRYRFHNDGDVFHTGYGCDTAGHAAAFIKEQFSNELSWWEDHETAFKARDIVREISNCASHGLRGRDYGEFLEELSHFVLVYTLSVSTENLRPNTSKISFHDTVSPWKNTRDSDWGTSYWDD